MTSKIVDAISDWVLQDPEARAKIRESMRPHLAQAWAEGYIEGRNAEIDGHDPREDVNPYEAGATQ